MRFYPLPPYDFTVTMDAARGLFIMGEIREGAYRRVIRLGDGMALVEVRSLGSVGQPELDAEILVTQGDIDETALWAKVRRVLNVGADLTPFYALAETDPVLKQTVQMLYGLHSLQADSVFEALALTIIEQQIALKMAQNAERWLLSWGGDFIQHQGERYYAFPRPERIAAASVEDLTPLKITFMRIQRLIELAKAAETLELLRDQPADVAYARLVALKGVGHWTAAWTLIRAQGHYPYVGAADVALRAAVNRYYFGLPGRAAVPLVDETFARYGAYSGLAAYYTLMRWAFWR